MVAKPGLLKQGTPEEQQIWNTWEKQQEYTRTDYKTNTQITKELKITPILDKLLEYKRKWIQHLNRMPRNRLPRVMKHYSRTGRRNHFRPLKILLDTWDRNGSTSGPTPWQIYDDNDDVWRNVRPLILCVKFGFKMNSLYISYRGHSPLVKTIEAWNCWVQTS